MRSNTFVQIALPLLALVGGCSRAPEPTSQPAPTSPFPPQPVDTRIALTPEDLLTDVSFTPIRVVMAPATSTQTLGSIANGLRLRTYPELVDVPFTTTVSPGNVGSAGNTPVAKDAAAAPWDPPQDAYVELNPKVALGPSAWYVVTADNLPATIAKPTRAILPKEPNAYAARFTTGSSPILRTVSVGDTGRVFVGFSEGVLIDEASIGATLQILDDALAPCSYVPRGMPNGPTVFSAPGISFQCAASAYKAKKVRVVLKGLLKTQDGAALQLLDGASTTTQGLLKPLGTFDVALVYGSPNSLTWSP